MKILNKKEKDNYAQIVEKLEKKMLELDPASEEYTECANSMVKLKAALKAEKVDANTKALIVANLVGICIVLFHESAHVIASKAFSMIRKLV